MFEILMTNGVPRFGPGYIR